MKDNGEKGGAKKLPAPAHLGHEGAEKTGVLRQAK